MSLVFIIFIYYLLLRFSYNTWEVTNCSNNQFTTVPLWLFMYVRVKHVKVSAMKNKYYIKNTTAAGVGFTVVGVWSVCVYIFYTARGDQVNYISLFGKREGWGHLCFLYSSCVLCFTFLLYSVELSLHLLYVLQVYTITAAPTSFLLGVIFSIIN